MNSIIQLDLRNLRRRLTTLQPMQFCNYRVKITGVPADMVSVSVVVQKVDGSRFVPTVCECDGNGDWFADIAGLCFPDDGEAEYQVGMVNAEGRPYAGGKGKIVVTKFDPITGMGEPLPDGKYLIASIPDDNGVAHRIVAVQVDGEWTWKMED